MILHDTQNIRKIKLELGCDNMGICSCFYIHKPRQFPMPVPHTETTLFLGKWWLDIFLLNINYSEIFELMLQSQFSPFLRRISLSVDFTRR